MRRTRENGREGEGEGDGEGEGEDVGAGGKASPAAGRAHLRPAPAAAGRRRRGRRGVRHGSTGPSRRAAWTPARMRHSHSHRDIVTVCLTRKPPIAMAPGRPPAAGASVTGAAARRRGGRSVWRVTARFPARRLFRVSGVWRASGGPGEESSTRLSLCRVGLKFRPQIRARCRADIRVIRPGGVTRDRLSQCRAVRQARRRDSDTDTDPAGHWQGSS